MEKVAVYIAAVFMIITSALLAGYVICHLWAWFVCPLGLPPLSLAHAIGLDLLITFATGKVYLGEKTDDWTVAKRLLTGAYLAPLFALLTGWIAQHWM